MPFYAYLHILVVGFKSSTFFIFMYFTFSWNTQSCCSKRKPVHGMRHTRPRWCLQQRHCLMFSISREKKKAFPFFFYDLFFSCLCVNMSWWVYALCMQMPLKATQKQWIPRATGHSLQLFWSTIGVAGCYRAVKNWFKLGMVAPTYNPKDWGWRNLVS